MTHLSTAGSIDTLIKSDDTTRVSRRVRQQGTNVIRKEYVVRGFLRVLRTFLQRSRAEREYRNLAALAAAGVPTVAVVAWGAERRLGCVRRSWLETECMAPVRDLSALIWDRSFGRQTLASYGRMLARLHEAGFVSTTAYPRNLLVREADPAQSMWFIDQPDLQRLSWLPLRWRRALGVVDLYDAAFSPSRCRDMAAPCRLRIVLGYTDGGRAEARALWRRWTGRSRRPIRFLKGSLRLYGVVRSHLRAWTAPFRRRSSAAERTR